MKTSGQNKYLTLNRDHIHFTANIGKGKTARVAVKIKDRTLTDDDISLLHKNFISLDSSGCRSLTDSLFNAIKDILEELSIHKTAITGKGLTTLPNSFNMLDDVTEKIRQLVANQSLLNTPR